MMIEVLKSKIHCARVTEANLNYMGSITIDEDLMDAANMIAGEKVYIADNNNGERFETYIIKGERGSGKICLNGAAARSCAHFGVKGVLLQDAALLESGAAIRTAEGGAEHVQPITGDSVLDALEQFRKAGYSIVTTSSHAGTPLFKATLPRKMVLVLGQERDGLSDAALSSADLSVSIDGTGNVESLNVSVATGVLLAEWWRQNKA